MTVVVDTSAILAILNEEAEATTFARLLRAAGHSFMSAGNAIEAHRVMLSRAGGRADAQLDRFLRHFALHIAPVDAVQVELARDGMERFGKGRRAAPAVLNFGDLFAYALARSLDAPLLFKGGDFAQTDIVPAWTA